MARFRGVIRDSAQWAIIAAAAYLNLHATAARAETIPGIHLFEQNCSGCHNNRGDAAPGAGQAPNLTTLQSMTPERIYTAITTGPMTPMAGKLNDDEKRDLAETLSGRILGAGDEADAGNMPNRCAGDTAPRDLLSGPHWEGWGNGIDNARFQSRTAGKMDAGNVAKLQLKWAFGFPGGSSAYGQPTVSGGRVYVGSDNAHVYSLDAKTGCVHWSFAAKAGVRTAPLIANDKDRKGARTLYFGDYRANVYAVDAQSGALLWEQHVDDHPYARIVGSIVMADGRLYIPMSNWEDVAVNNPAYECCTARGNVIALDARTGSQLWKSYVIPEVPKPTHKNEQGVLQYAPAGAMVWLTPTIDLKQRAVYVGTSDAKGEVAAPQSDAIVAFDMDTGRMKWWFQGWAGDAHGTKGYVDFDFGSSPVLTTLRNGKRLLVAAQKSGVVHALDPDRAGKVVWQTRMSDVDDRTFGWRSDAVIWGPAMHADVGYFALINGALLAMQMSTGKRLWTIEPPPQANPSEEAKRGFPGSKKMMDVLNAHWVGKQAALTLVPGAVFSGAVDGILRAYSTLDGKVLWEFDTAHEFTTVNGVKAHGGTLSGPGPAVAEGMLFVNSGYGILHATPGNVLLAFAVAD
jgi:polyvinyl alcohol dehydrogenase (cytochrome)